MNTSWRELETEITTCRACPRLVTWREQVALEKRRAYRDWDYWGRPVPGFGDPAARLLVVGLAPGAHGSNRTGRMFTGDSSGDTLYTALHRAGFASQPTSRRQDDGLTLSDAFITAVARCAPPENRPTPAEIAACRSFLYRELALLSQVQVLVALGQIAFDGCLRLLRDHNYQWVEAEAKEHVMISSGLPSPACPATEGSDERVPGPLKFGHGRHYAFANAAPTDRKHLITAYHPSRQNTQTGRLTPEMLDEVFVLARSLLE
jgi:uracil-DNA glycosylase family 4